MHNLFTMSVLNWNSNITFIVYSQFFFLFFIIFILCFSLVLKHFKIVSFFRYLCISVILGLFIYIGFLVVLLNSDFGLLIFWDDQFVISKFTLFVQIFICLITICVFISLIDYFSYENFISFELPILILLCIQGMFILVSANDLFIIYLALELQSLSLYILASLKRYSNLSIEAGLKYFILGSFASGLFLYGVSLIYGFTGSTNLSDIYLYLWTSTFSNDLSVGIFIGFIFILVGLLFKLGLAPFHYWIVDVYDGSATIITYFFSIVPKVAIFICFLNVYNFVWSPIYGLVNFSSSILWVSVCCALFSILSDQ